MIPRAPSSRASRRQQTELRFGDGTVIELGRETRGRLGAIDGNGAHVAIEHGSAHVNVVHKPNARWRIDAGPYQITVHGTVFTAAWDESQQRLDVKMERGLVSVSGPVTNGPIAVRGGQGLTVRMKRSQVLLRDLAEEDAADLDAATAEEELGAPAIARRRRRPCGRGSRGAAEGTRPQRVGKSWTAALSAGDFDAILEEAERDIGHVLASRGTEDSGGAGRRRPLPPPRRRRAPGVARAAPPVRGIAARRGRRLLPRPSATRTAAAAPGPRWPGTNAISTKHRAARTWPKRSVAR